MSSAVRFAGVSAGSGGGAASFFGGVPGPVRAQPRASRTTSKLRRRTVESPLSPTTTRRGNSRAWPLLPAPQCLPRPGAGVLAAVEDELAVDDDVLDALAVAERLGV